ncbi:hypothetical protein Ddc_00883 [Ditylenchus destructor]|nr:hypothetical protein Ddc_00883 [Ditylenchus destructor]
MGLQTNKVRKGESCTQMFNHNALSLRNWDRGRSPGAAFYDLEVKSANMHMMICHTPQTQLNRYVAVEAVLVVVLLQTPAGSVTWRINAHFSG